MDLIDMLQQKKQAEPVMSDELKRKLYKAEMERQFDPFYKTPVEQALMEIEKQIREEEER